MAVTKIHAVRASVQKAIDYICNPDKTDGEMLVDSFGCSPKTAGVEFDMALSHGSGRGRNKAFHLIQSFAPGEVDAETAHRIGKELAERLLHGDRSYVVATHIDKTSVHNHIIFCAADSFTGRKFVCRKKTYRDIRRISDGLCEENGLSVIENPQRSTGLSYEDWIAKGHEEPLREKLRRDIRECIKFSATYDDFIRLMRERDYEVKGEDIPGIYGFNGMAGCRKAAKYFRFR
ncbi:MAG: relaxase/mobilization nuclease domain-containing protein, partial [Lachnospiraceae bacterium]|nr:relaxase/mobilization nuclease domain-containing protein [Lachnospiraceae bacterium]